MMRVPLWLKVTYTIWVIVWTSLYAHYYPVSHFLWMCHIGNGIIAVALWSESRLLFSWQAVSLLLADVIYVIDFFGRIATGQHVVGASIHFFSADVPLLQRGLSLFHLVMPFLLTWALLRFGYDRRALWLQLATCWVLFPLSYWFGEVADDVNWVRGPFNHVQHTISPPLYLLVAMTVYPLVVYLPSHLFFWAVFGKRAASTHGVAAAEMHT